MFRKKRSGASNQRGGGAHRRVTFYTSSGTAPALGSQRLADVLSSCEARREQYLRCSGMHTESVKEVVRTICDGKLNNPSYAFVAPALYEGIPEFLNQMLDVLGQIAVYSSLIVGIIASAGMSGFYPKTEPGAMGGYYSGVFSGMCANTMVVAIEMFYRYAAVGHMRDSDKLLFLWRARHVPYVAVMLWILGIWGPGVALALAVNDTVYNGGACFAGKDPTMHWTDWWEEWVGLAGAHPPQGAGIVHPKGEQIPNPWMLRANELGISAPDPIGMTACGDQELVDQYSEFMRDHFGFDKSCQPQQALHEHFGGFGSGGIGYMHQFLIAFFPISYLCAFYVLIRVGPTRHMFNYWSAQPAPVWKQYTLGFLGWVTPFYFFGPLAETKTNDPFDMTEAFEEFKLRAAVGLELAKKDTTGDGFVNLEENQLSLRLSHGELLPEELPEDHLASADFGALLEALGLDKKYGALAKQIELESLRSLAQDGGGECLNELKDAGVSVGDRIKIVQALRHGLPEKTTEDSTSASSSRVGEVEAFQVSPARDDAELLMMTAAAAEGDEEPQRFDNFFCAVGASDDVSTGRDYATAGMNK